MGTKNNPGEFDCYANAQPDEPMFVLLGRDKHAPALVWLWAVLRQLDGEKPEVWQDGVVPTVWGELNYRLYEYMPELEAGKYNWVQIGGRL